MAFCILYLETNTWLQQNLRRSAELQQNKRLAHPRAAGGMSSGFEAYFETEEHAEEILDELIRWSISFGISTMFLYRPEFEIVEV
jgi:hypothetical protein